MYLNKAVSTEQQNQHLSENILTFNILKHICEQRTTTGYYLLCTFTEKHVKILISFVIKKSKFYLSEIYKFVFECIVFISKYSSKFVNIYLEKFINTVSLIHCTNKSFFANCHTPLNLKKKKH